VQQMLMMLEQVLQLLLKFLLQLLLILLDRIIQCLPLELHRDDVRE
jgi:hypothetical protein